jgi:hypothetical protein
MKKALNSVFILMVVVIFLTGTTGISFSFHECTSSHRTEVFPFPEILNNTVSCCCADEVHDGVAGEEPVSSFSEPECCRNTHVYLKASFTGFPVSQQLNPDLSYQIISPDLLNLFYKDLNIEIPDLNVRVDHPPPRSGKILVYFLQQIKIPAQVS